MNNKSEILKMNLGYQSSLKITPSRKTFLKKNAH